MARSAAQAYVRGERFNQPIFGANNLSGAVFSVRHAGAASCFLKAWRTDVPCLRQVADGGPAGGQPPHNFTVYFNEARRPRRTCCLACSRSDAAQGGCGTLLPLFFHTLHAAREAAASPMVAPRAAGEVEIEMRELRAAAYIDPNDPTLLFLPEVTLDGGAPGELAEAPATYPLVG